MKKKKRIVYNLCLAVLICIFLGSAGYLAYYFLQSKKSEDQFQKLEAMIDAPVNEEEIVYVATDGDAEPGLEFVNIDGTRVQKSFASLYRENHDFIGWLSIEDTNIDYPVMQTKKDSEYYLHRNFEKKSDVNGLPFLDAKCDIDELKGNLMVYGHHMKSGLMFAHLEDFEKADFYKKHKTIEFDTLYEKRQYEVVAVFRSKVYKENKKLSIYKDGATPAYGEQLLTLVTCAYHTENGRFVVVARKKENV